MPHRITDQQMTRLSEYITRWLGLHFPKKRWRDLERIIVHAAPELGFEETKACIERLVSGSFSKEQEDILASHLTIGETYFFREQKSFEILEKRILPELIASRRGREQRLRIWSAGCSTGEEPYSLAILLSRLIPDLREWHITILATDVNSRSLGKAEQGVYGEWSFRGVPEWIRQRYFTRRADGLFELPHGIRRMVTFAVLNLAEDTFPSLATNTNAMDIVLCRNVLMYFDPQLQQRVIKGFQRSLLDNGWLLVSPCETSSAFSASFETVMFPDAAFYRKGANGEKPHRIVPPAPAQPVPAPPPVTSPPVAAKRPRPQIIEQTPPPEFAPYEEALALYRQGSYADAAEMLSGPLARCEGATVAAAMFEKGAALMAQSLANLGKVASALEWTEKAIAVDKLNAGLYYLRATILQEQGTPSQAIASLKQALYLDHAFVLAHYTLGILTLQQGKPREAGRHFENALTLLGACQGDDPVPGSEGMTAARLSEIITATRASINL